MTTSPADEFSGPELRRQAELRLQNQLARSEPVLSAVNMHRLLHELQVHQIELELQNEGLRESLAQVESAAERYANFYDFASVGYVTLNRSGDISQCNLALASLLGTERASLVGARFGLFVVQADKDIFYRCIEDVFTSQMQQTCALQLDTKNGQLCFVHMQATISSDGAELRAVLLDVTEGRHIKEALRESESRLALALHSTGDGIWDWNIGNQGIFFSNRLAEMLGYSPDEFGSTRASWTSRVLPEDLPMAQAAIAAHLAGDTVVYECEYRMLCKDGSIRWILARGQVQQRNAAGEPLRMLGTHADITERKHADERRLAQNLALRDTLVREVHHRIKNNLQGVVGLLRDFAQNHPQIEPVMAKAMSQVQSVAIIHGLQGQAQPSQVRLCELTSIVAQSVETLWQVPVSVTIPQPWVRRVVTPEDAVPVALVLNELMVNAIKHGKPAKSPVQVALSGVDETCAAMLSIVNNGDWLLPAASSQVAPGVGLELVQSLLPRHGAELTHQAQDGCVHTLLLLRPPVLSIDN